MINCIFKLIEGKFKIEDFHSLNTNEQTLFIETIFKSRAHFLIFSFFQRYADIYKEYQFFRIAKGVSSLSTLQSITHIEEALKLNKLLFENEITFVFLKGIHLVSEYYKDITERPMRDVDILIDKSDLSHVVQLLIKNGYSFEFEIDKSSLDEFIEDSYTIPVLIGENGVRLEVHFSIENTSSKKECNFCEIFLRDAKINEIGTSRIPVLSSEDLILHLIYHGFKKQGPDVGIIFIADIYRVLLSNNYDDLALIEKAKLYKLIPHLKIIVELLCFQSSELRLKSLSKKIEFDISDEAVSKVKPIFFRNDLIKQEIRLLQVIKRFQLIKIIRNYNRASIAKEYNLDIKRKTIISFSFFLRILRHIKVVTKFVFKLIFIRSFRLQFYKMNKVIKYIDDL